MHFVEILDGGLLPLSKIERLWSKAGCVYVKSGEETHQILGPLDKVRDGLEPIFPAAIGWEVVTLHLNARIWIHKFQ